MHALSEYKHLVKQTSLSRSTVSRRISDLSDNIEETLKDRLKSCEAFSLALTLMTRLNLSFLSELLRLTLILLKSF